MVQINAYNNNNRYAIRTSQRYVRIHVSVNLLPIHTNLYSYVYRAWYELVPACNSSSSWNPALASRAHIYHHQASRTQKRRWTRAEVNEGANTGPPQMPPGAKLVARWWRSKDKSKCIPTPTHTRIHKGRNNNCIKKAHAVGKRSGNFLTATCTQATIGYGEMSSLRSDVWFLIKNPV